MLYIWAITVRRLAFCASERTTYTFHVATESMSERSAAKFARAQYSDAWWDDNLLTDVKEVGRLRAAEGLEVPRDDD